MNKICLGIILIVLSQGALATDWHPDAINLTCISNINFLEVVATKVPNINFQSPISKNGTSYYPNEAELVKYIENNSNLILEATKKEKTCSFTNEKYEIIFNHEESSDHGMCAAAPGGSISIKNSKGFVIKELPINKCYGLNIQSIMISNTDITICSTLGTKYEGGRAYCIDNIRLKPADYPITQQSTMKEIERLQKIYEK